MLRQPVRSPARPLPRESERLPPADMQQLRVVTFSIRRGSGIGVLLNSGRRIRIQWGALREAGVTVLDPGDLIYVRLDPHDRDAASALFIP